MRPISIRWTMSLWYGGVMGITLIFLASIIWFYLRFDLLQRVDEELGFEIDRLHNTYLREYQEIIEDQSSDPDEDEEIKSFYEEIIEEVNDNFLSNPKNIFVQLVDENDSLFFRSADLKISLNGINSTKENVVSLTTVSLDKVGNIRLAYLQTSKGRFYIGHSLQNMEDLLDKIINIMIAVIPFGIIIITAGGYYLSRKSFKPVEEATKMAESITAQNLHERLPDRNVDDEIGRLIKTLNHMIEGLEEAFLTIQQFSIDASHELRTPLTIIRGEMETLLGRKVSYEQLQAIISRCLEEISYATGIIEALFFLAKGESNQIFTKIEIVDMSDLVREVYEDAQILAADKSLVCNLKANEPVKIKGDKRLIRQLLLNLVDNAIKYTEKGEVNLSLTQTESHADFVIADTGIGISKNDIPNIFKRFYRADKSHSRRSGGSGLGLKICTVIVKVHRGTIDVSSAEGKGSEFRVLIPLANDINSEINMKENNG